MIEETLKDHEIDKNSVGEGEQKFKVTQEVSSHCSNETKETHSSSDDQETSKGSSFEQQKNQGVHKNSKRGTLSAETYIQMMGITISVLNLSGLVKNERKKYISSLLPPRSLSHSFEMGSISHFDDKASAASSAPFVSAFVSHTQKVSEKNSCIATYIPSLPLDLSQPDPEKQAAWPAADDGTPRSTIKLSKMNEKSQNSDQTEPMVEEPIELGIGVLRGKEMIKLGVATLVVTGEIDETIMSLPVKKTARNKSMKAPLSKKLFKFGHRRAGQYSLDDNAQLQIKLKVELIKKTNSDVTVNSDGDHLLLEVEADCIGTHEIPIELASKCWPKFEETPQLQFSANYQNVYPEVLKFFSKIDEVSILTPEGPMFYNTKGPGSNESATTLEPETQSLEKSLGPEQVVPSQYFVEVTIDNDEATNVTDEIYDDSKLVLRRYFSYEGNPSLDENLQEQKTSLCRFTRSCRPLSFFDCSERTNKRNEKSAYSDETAQTEENSIVTTESGYPMTWERICMMSDGDSSSFDSRTYDDSWSYSSGSTKSSMVTMDASMGDLTVNSIIRAKETLERHAERMGVTPEHLVKWKEASEKCVI